MLALTFYCFPSFYSALIFVWLLLRVFLCLLTFPNLFFCFIFDKTGFCPVGIFLCIYIYNARFRLLHFHFLFIFSFKISIVTKYTLIEKEPFFLFFCLVLLFSSKPTFLSSIFNQKNLIATDSRKEISICFLLLFCFSALFLLSLLLVFFLLLFSFLPKIAKGVRDRRGKGTRVVVIFVIVFLWLLPPFTCFVLYLLSTEREATREGPNGAPNFILRARDRRKEVKRKELSVFPIVP